MNIQRKMRRINHETHQLETYLDDQIFHSFKEMKNYCVANMNHVSLFDSIVFVFVVTDTDEEIRIFANREQDSDGFYYVALDYYFDW